MSLLDNPAFARIAEKVVKTTFPQEHEQRELFQEYFFPLTDDNGVRYWHSDRREQLLYFRPQEQIWFLSSAAQPKVPIATSQDLKEWQLGSGTVTAPLHVLRTRSQENQNSFASASGAVVFTFDFQKKLKDLSGSYEYFCQYNNSPCFRRWKMPQLFLLQSSAGLWVIRGSARQDLCTSSNLVHFERPDKKIEKAKSTVAEEWPEPPAPASSSTPVQPEAHKKRKITIGYNMEEVRKYVEDEHADGLQTRAGEDCDMKVIYEVFGRACYQPSENLASMLFQPKSTDYVLDLGGHIGTATAWFLQQGISGADVYEPTGTYAVLQKNLGQDARVTLHQQAVVHEMSATRIGGFRSRADSAHGDPHSDSVVIRAGGDTYYFKQIGSYQTVVMCTEFSRRWPMASRFIRKVAADTPLEERVEAMRKELAQLEFLGLHLEGSFEILRRRCCSRGASFRSE